MPRTIAKTQTGIGNLNTNIWTGEEYFQVQLYSTIVYDEQKDKITLRHGGWVTPTTSRRIRQVLRYRGHNHRVNIKNGVMLCDGKTFINGEFIIQKGGTK